MKMCVVCISAAILILQTVCVSLIHATENDLTAKMCTLAIFFITIAGTLFFAAISLKNWKRYLAISLAGITLLLAEFWFFFRLLIHSLST
jgi:uncharacterized membrane protein